MRVLQSLLLATAVAVAASCSSTSPVAPGDRTISPGNKAVTDQTTEESSDSTTNRGIWTIGSNG